MADQFPFAHAPVPTLMNTRYTFRVIGLDTEFDLQWRAPNSANPANVVPVPADAAGGDVQTFIFGPMSHSMTLRPFRPPVGCCAAPVYTFDLAPGMFGDKFGQGEIENGCCVSDVKVNISGGQILRGEIKRNLCGLQPRTDLTWSTGEVASFRGPPACGPCCGPWRMGFVGSVPSEEENFQVRYWDAPWMFLDCNIAFMCRQCCAPFCIACGACCQCRDKFGFTTWTPLTLEGVRSHLLSSYGMVLYSSFGQPVFEAGNEFQAVGTRGTQHLSDINALGNYRMTVTKNSCCKFIFMDPSDTHDHSEQMGLDLMFRGTFNQNQLAPQDFNLALGYLILNVKGFLDMTKQGAHPLQAARQLPGALTMADVRPVPAGSKMV